MSAAVMQTVPGYAVGQRLRRAMRRVGVVMMVCGGALCTRALYMHAKAELAGYLIAQAWSQTLSTGKSAPPWPWADTFPIARLTIPAIGYDEVVLEGASPRVLAFGPARMMNTARPGEGGNMVLAGHRTSWFLPLKDVKLGDELRLEWRDDVTGHAISRRYQVSELTVIEPSNLGYLQPTESEYVTLMTCYPFGARPDSPQRYVVRARPIPS